MELLFWANAFFFLSMGYFIVVPITIIIAIALHYFIGKKHQKKMTFFYKIFWSFTVLFFLGAMFALYFFANFNWNH